MAFCYQKSKFAAESRTHVLGSSQKLKAFYPKLGGTLAAKVHPETCLLTLWNTPMIILYYLVIFLCLFVRESEIAGSGTVDNEKWLKARNWKGKRRHCQKDDDYSRGYNGRNLSGGKDYTNGVFIHSKLAIICSIHVHAYNGVNDRERRTLRHWNFRGRKKIEIEIL